MLTLRQPAWMKVGGSMKGGSVKSQFVGSCGLLLSSFCKALFADDGQDAKYLLKSIQGFQDKGFSVYAISIQVS